MENKKNSQLKKVTFFADVMLGMLAKWLRILGYDTAYSRDIQHEKLASLAKKERRMVLTRSRKIIKLLEPSEYILIEGNFVVEQLKQVVRELNLDIAGNPVFTRCLICNGELVSFSREGVKEEVPDFIYKRYDEFSKCLNCSRVYWPGTHYNRVEEIIKRIKAE